MLSTHMQKLPASGLMLELTRVPTFLVGIYLIFFALIASACYLSLSMLMFLMLLPVVAAYGQFLLRKNLLRSHPSAFKKLVFTELGWCYVCLNDGRIIKADIDVDSIVSEHLILLNLTEQKETAHLFAFFHHYSVILTAGELGCEQFRRAKRHLRLINFSRKDD